MQIKKSTTISRLGFTCGGAKDVRRGAGLHGFLLLDNGYFYRSNVDKSSRVVNLKTREGSQFSRGVAKNLIDKILRGVN